MDDDAIRRCCSRRSRSTSWSSPRGRPRRGRRRQGPARPWAASRLPCRSPPRWVWPASPSHRYPGSRGAGSSVALGRSPPGAGKDPRTRGPRSGGPPERRPRNARRPCRRSAACPRGRPSRSARRGRQPRGAERVDSSRMLAAHRLPTVAATARCRDHASGSRRLSRTTRRRTGPAPAGGADRARARTCGGLCPATTGDKRHWGSISTTRSRREVKAYREDL